VWSADLLLDGGADVDPLLGRETYSALVEVGDGNGDVALEWGVDERDHALVFLSNNKRNRLPVRGA